MGLYSGGLIIGRIFASEIWGAYFREGLFLEGLIIGILRCKDTTRCESEDPSHRKSDELRKTICWIDNLKINNLASYAERLVILLARSMKTRRSLK